MSSRIIALVEVAATGLMQLFHFAEQRRRWDDLYQKLVGSCYAAGIPLSSPSENDLSAQPEVLPIAEQAASAQT